MCEPVPPFFCHPSITPTSRHIKIREITREELYTYKNFTLMKTWDPDILDQRNISSDWSKVWTGKFANSILTSTIHRDQLFNFLRPNNTSEYIYIIINIKRKCNNTKRGNNTSDYIYIDINIKRKMKYKERLYLNFFSFEYKFKWKRGCILTFFSFEYKFKCTYCKVFDSDINLHNIVKYLWLF